MTTVSAAPLPAAFNADAFDTFLSSRDEPAWVADARRTAFETFQEKSESELDPEEWRRVNLRLLRPDKFRLGTGTDAANFETGLQHAAEFAGRITHADGRAAVSGVSEELTAKGVLFGDLAGLVRTHGEQIRRHLFSAVKSDADRFSAWHAAFWTGGTVLIVPDGVKLDQPLYSLIGLATEGATDLSHTLIVLGEGASAALLEETASAGEGAGLHLGAVELILGRGAELRYVQLQNWNGKTFHIAHQAGRVATDALLQWTVGGLGSQLAHAHQDINLEGRSSRAEVNGVTFATGRQQISYYTQQNHRAYDTRSDLLYKTVLRDRAQAVWRGMIRVEPEAQRTDGYQRCDSLMLSDTARSDSIPGLEIEADDVRCTHGATTGQVDAEQLFYCMARGLTRFEAMHIIVEGFFHQIYDRIPVEAVRKVLSAAVEKKLGIGD